MCEDNHYQTSVVKPSRFLKPGRFGSTGFTLVELIIVIVITSILSTMGVLFIKLPIEQYLGIARRAEMTDIADTALRRMERDIGNALPHSVRISSSYIEFLPITTGGRYRANAAPSGSAKCGSTLAEDKLDFTQTDSCFEIMGTLLTTPEAGQELVVNNTSLSLVYAEDNVAIVDAASTTDKIVFAAKQFPTPSPDQHFQIISTPVTFACVGTTLWHYSGYTKQNSQPTDITNSPLSTAPNKAMLATNVDCAASSFFYMESAELVTISLILTESGESISLYHKIHVNNLP